MAESMSGFESDVMKAGAGAGSAAVPRLEQLAVALSARAPGAVVGWRDGNAVRNAEFLARMWRWYDLLQGQAGSQYALYLEDAIEFGAALLGAWQAGKTIWICADTLEASCATMQVSVDGFLGEFPEAYAPLRPVTELSGQALAQPRAARMLDGAFAALVVFTSGSTGAAQAISKKLSQMANETATLNALFGPTVGNAGVLATVSHQHIYGLLFKVLAPLSAGRAIHAISIIYPEQLAAALGAGPCVLVASPAHLKRLPAHLDWRGATANLRAVFSSGGPLALETAQACGTLLGKVPVEVYGSSETGGIAWRQRSAGSDESWQAFPGVEWRLAGNDMASEALQLEVRSAHLADDHWLQLADRAAGAGSGRFLLLGRSDRIVKIEEKRISLDAIEAALVASALAAEVRVVLCAPVPGERQRLAAFVIPTAAGRDLLAAGGKRALNQRLRMALAGAVDAVALPRRWRYLDQMPVNAQGKTTLAALLALLVDTAVEPRRLPYVRELERERQPVSASGSVPGATPPLRRILLAVTAPADLLYFQGHFDIAPVLPGVVQIEWAMQYGRRYFALPARFRGINALKFQHVIRPDMPVQLELVHDTQKNSLNFRYLSDAGQHASGRIQFDHGGTDA
jgi:acyl-coenzyme A synthetase/AMP-(fatty) acid ligase